MLLEAAICLAQQKEEAKLTGLDLVISARIADLQTAVMCGELQHAML